MICFSVMTMPGFFSANAQMLQYLFSYQWKEGGGFLLLYILSLKLYPFYLWRWEPDSQWPETFSLQAMQCCKECVNVALCSGLVSLIWVIDCIPVKYSNLNRWNTVMWEMHTPYTFRALMQHNSGHKYTHTHTHTHTHTCLHIHAHTHTHTHRRN